MLAREADIVILDFESTGSSPGKTNLPWQLGAVCFSGGKVQADHAFSIYLRVPADYPFNPYAPGRWACLRDELAAAPTLPELWPQLQAWLLDRPLGAHHAPTERSLLQQAFPFHNFGPWIDTLTLARIAYPGLSSFHLEDLLSEFAVDRQVAQLCPGRQAHDALYDAVACAYLLQFLLSRPSWRDISLESLCNAKPAGNRGALP
jgi:DNA polymerase-3 subunit epsilon